MRKLSALPVDRRSQMKLVKATPRNWTELAIEFNSDSTQLTQAAYENKLWARYAASQARAGIPWPGETIAKLHVIDAVSEPNPVGRCV